MVFLHGLKLGDQIYNVILKIMLPVAVRKTTNLLCLKLLPVYCIIYPALDQILKPYTCSPGSPQAFSMDQH